MIKKIFLLNLFIFNIIKTYYCEESNDNDLPSNENLISVDRALHIRSLPEIMGLQSNLYEVFMEPYPYGFMPLFAVASLTIGGNDPNSEEGEKANVAGDLMFLQPRFPSGPVYISGNITGLPPGKHAITIHDFGDTRKRCSLVGKHFNPHQLPHGDPKVPVRHVGDLGNIMADENGLSTIKIIDSLVSLSGGPRSIIGRSIVIHQMEDDYGMAGTPESMNSGSSGNAIACGVIGIIN